MNEKEAKEKILNIVDRCAWDHELDSHEATDRIYDEVVRPAERKVTHLYDVYDSLGIKWGDDPFNAIAKLKARLDSAIIVFKEASNEPCPNWCKSRQAVAQFLNEGGDNAD